MEGSGILALCAVACAAASGTLIGTCVVSRGRARLKSLAKLDLDSSERMLLLARSVGSPFRGIARLALRSSTCQAVAQDALAYLGAEERLDAESFMSMLVCASLLTGLVAFALTLSPAFALAATGLCFLGTGLFVRHKRDAQTQEVRDQVPEALRSLSDSFRSGHSLLQTMQQASAELDGSLAQMFGAAARSLELGRSTSESLSALQEVQGVPELAFVGVALDVQHTSGGSIAPVLESARESVEEQLELARSLRVQTAQAKLSASIVTLMPFLLIAFFSLASPGFLSPFFESVLGVFLLLVALGMQMAGVVAVRRICKVDE